MKNRQKDLNVFNEKFNDHVFYSCKCTYKNKEIYKNGTLFSTPDNLIFISYDKIDSFIFNVPTKQINSFSISKSFIKNNLILNYGNNFSSTVEFNNETDLNCFTLFINIYKYNESNVQLDKIEEITKEEQNTIDAEITRIQNQVESKNNETSEPDIEINEENETINEFFIVGTLKNKELNDNFELSVNELINRVKRVKYGNDTKSKLKEALEIYDKIYKYNPMRSQDVKLIREPENIYDKNSIAVYLRNRKVGYVKRNQTEQANKYINQKLKPIARISGGPFKTLDFFDEIVEEDGLYKLIITFE